ncbi:hypothetical protein E1287_19655 [Actinomadura sp. KC06]|uniref:hypothetical protein n=1 Tax=Actinomadura sp. KC06 TaxID=2530369 RepID=UPI001048F064|nr:hypothetical protein [Actinomadura sp. KC06]TDD33405.1 hypothetical protein E1287_19655 [Actinomadura sp. KC06]
MALSRRTRIVVVVAGLAGAATVAAGGAALADSGPEPVRTQLQIVDYQPAKAGTPGKDCPERDGGASGGGAPAESPAEGVQ